MYFIFITFYTIFFIILFYNGKIEFRLKAFRHLRRCFENKRRNNKQEKDKKESK